MSDRKKSIVAKNRQLRESMKLKSLERQNQVMEAFASSDFVEPFVDLFDRVRQELPLGLTTTQNRKHGCAYPFVTSEQQLAVFRGASRLLVGTNSYAQGMIDGLCSYVFGSGFTYRARLKPTAGQEHGDLLPIVQAIVDESLKRNQWHGGEQPGLEEEALWRACEDGEFIYTSFLGVDGWTTITTAEPEHLTQKPGTDFATHGFGIETPPGHVQQHIAYWITFDDDAASGQEYRPDQVTHFRANVKRSVKRGMPDFTFDTYDAFSQGSTLRGNMSMGAAMQAAYAIVVQHESASKSDVQTMQALLADYQRTNPVSGRSESFGRPRVGRKDIDKGQQYVPPPSAQNGAAHIEILSAGLRGAGRKWNAPEWLINGDASNNNFAGQLVAESPFCRGIIRRQNGLKATFTPLVWNMVVNRLKKLGNVKVKTAEGGDRTYTWQQVLNLVELQVEAPSPTVRNKLQEAQQAQIEIPLGCQSPQNYMQEQGRDPGTVQADLDAWKELNGPALPALPGLPGGGAPPGPTFPGSDA